MKKRLTKSDKGMIQSCFTYRMLWFGDNRYLDPIVERVGKEVVEKEIQRLEDTYTINYSVYTDSEGCSYNALVKKT